MRVALPLFEREIAPRFCATQRFLVADVEDEVVTAEAEHTLDGRDGPSLLSDLVDLKVTVLLCGGINRQFIPSAQARGLEVHWGLWGDARETLRAWVTHQPLRALRGRGLGRKHRHSPIPFSPGRSQQMTQRRVAISILTPDGLDGLMDEHFGRAKAFVISDESGQVVEVFDNPHLDASHGAGPATVATLARKGVNTVISGHYGPKAADALRGLGLQPWLGEKGLSAGELLERLRAGTLREG
ncbi:MAG: hypothetical protein JXX28_03595 [Deltaproteobacteria bacterium]|nr:hypothetical protein [Deltaproteobacteria bacterium]